MWLEFTLILLFILVNGFFAGSEIAVVTSRLSKIEALKEKGNKKAASLLHLKQNPDKFLATVQVGITFVSALASAIGGAAAVKEIKPIIELIPLESISLYSEALAIAIVVCIVAYLSLILGELVPKSIALMNPERVALTVAGPITLFSRLSGIFVTILTTSTNFILKPFGKEAFTQRAYVSEEEIKLLIKEGRDKGIFEPDEQELIHSVFEFTDISVKEVMVPIVQVKTLSIDTPQEDILQTTSQERFSRYPVYSKEINNIKGVLYAKDVFRVVAENRPMQLSKLLRAPFFVPETLMISNLLREMQKKSTHMAIVVNEHGMITGIVTIEDLLEEIVGEIRDEFDFERPVITIGDGVYIVFASIHLRDLKEDYEIEVPESPLYDTLGGFIVTTMQKIPKNGDVIELENIHITVLEMVENRVSKVRLELKSGCEFAGEPESE